MCTYSYKHQTAMCPVGLLFLAKPPKASFLWHNSICLPPSWIWLDWKRRLEKIGQRKEVVNEERVMGAWW